MALFKLISTFAILFKVIIFYSFLPFIKSIEVLNKNGSLSTVVGDEKLTSREDRIGPLFMYVQCDEDTFLKVDEVSKTEP